MFNKIIILLVLLIFTSCKNNYIDYQRVSFNGDQLFYEEVQILSSIERTKLSSLLTCAKIPFRVDKLGKIYIVQEDFNDIEKMYNITLKLDKKGYFESCNDCKLP